MFVAQKHYTRISSADWENAIFMTISAPLSVLYKNVAIMLA
jgi:hypothetical protein